eukprot:TRINITY_DN5417_c0_g1_i11.p1 TRINITY_DN5417_c0_g1~~TRINITY_DN5417_c0_g1_i11.p1  ORF type:complete len:119 (-),score=6.56 TRINITY_DN5417_c0_g1_i11:7-363(-)
MVCGVIFSSMLCRVKNQSLISKSELKEKFTSCEDAVRLEALCRGFACQLRVVPWSIFSLFSGVNLVDTGGNELLNVLSLLFIWVISHWLTCNCINTLFFIKLKLLIKVYCGLHLTYCG